MYKGLIVIVVVVFSAVAVGVLFFDSFVRVDYFSSPETGDQIIIKLPKWIDKDMAINSFSINPVIDGELVWIDDFRELHFLPRKGFEPGMSYKVNVGLPTYGLGLIMPIAKEYFVMVDENIPLPNKINGIPLEGKFIEANLQTMTMTLYQNGKVVETFKIAGKGNPATSPTIQGNFSIKTKETNHFSSLSHVWMPWSMQFEGDYFIHEWPYWPGGKRIETKYSGGCIRLYEGDSKKVYDFAEIGTQFAVHSTPLISESDLKSGDLVRENSSSDVYIIKNVSDKKYRRKVPVEKISQWYPNISQEGIKIVSDGILDGYLKSKWVVLPPGDNNINGTVYEIDNQWVKHRMNCSVSNCLSAWGYFGWDSDEIYTVTQEELDYYPSGDDVPLVAAY
ncbi:MAG: hypothetical protein COV29_01790 [Candidatus Yanofskybacteria bacterium CG10_big_fil_rev_8_21_14_0_10_36_16]|uniref:L,D-TPase catalytic domain-containing protein n=1 Tax=Candidatus Yanofskybacteria bacterium CG10_big_fil_rev_8_21_14_0_10_36_16 TaxID=1975096 RepID=A0A2J0Q7E8_9BACT|nr:MAG: hypothetical protein COV29_01790 [Candidatus Yanofskybacteria bacterium CG10_big_fil_rev_8_21_14_0_10_36_16]